MYAQKVDTGINRSKTPAEVSLPEHDLQQRTDALPAATRLCSYGPYGRPTIADIPPHVGAIDIPPDVGAI